MTQSSTVSDGYPIQDVRYGMLPYLLPCRLCPHVIVVEGLVCVSDPWGYSVEPLMPDRTKVRRQTKRDKEVYTARRLWRFASRTRLYVRHTGASELATA